FADECWSSPVLVTFKDGKSEVVLNAADVLIGFDPDTGERLWTCEGVMSLFPCSTPVVRDGIVYAMGSGRGQNASILAVRAGGRGNVTKTHVLWQTKGGANYCSPLLMGDHLYWISGEVHCLNAKTGEVVYEKRLYEDSQEYVSPVAVDGR